MLDKILYEEEVRQLMNTYEQQFHYGVFYAYMRLRCVAVGEWASGALMSAGLVGCGRPGACCHIAMPHASWLILLVC